MNNSPKALVIVEGEKSEKEFFNKIKELYKLNLELIWFGTNIYVLYNKMKNYGFNVDVKKVLEEMIPDQKEILNENFAYTYLFFDLDAHHKNTNDAREFNEVINDNLNIISEMVNYFNDETDPTIGKLYINYPMFESIRACDSCFNENYKFEVVNITELKRYKEIVKTKKLSGKHINSYTKADINSLVKMNIFKLSYISVSKWNILQYDEYRNFSEQDKILSKEVFKIKSENQISVINTSVFSIVDYYGNKNGFYDSVVK